MKRRQIAPAALPAIGQPLAGGFFAGRMFFNGAEHAVIDSGREFETLAQWPSPSMTATPTPWPWPKLAAP